MNTALVIIAALASVSLLIMLLRGREQEKPEPVITPSPERIQQSVQQGMTLRATQEELNAAFQEAADSLKRTQVVPSTRSPRPLPRVTKRNASRRTSGSSNASHNRQYDDINQRYYDEMEPEEVFIQGVVMSEMAEAYVHNLQSNDTPLHDISAYAPPEPTYTPPAEPEYRAPVWDPPSRVVDVSPSYEPEPYRSSYDSGSSNDSSSSWSSSDSSSSSDSGSSWSD